MKKIAIFTTALVMCMGVMNAQVEQLMTPDESFLSETFVENVGPSSVELPSLEGIQDLSFPSEREWTLYLAQQKNIPNKITAGILSIVLGDIGIGHFYTGQILRGVLDVLFFWTGVPGLIGLIEGIIWLSDDDAEWEERCAKWNN